MKMKCLIVEDEPIAQEILKSYIDRTNLLEAVATFNNALEAFSFLQTNHVELLFLDVKMPQMTGIELLKALSYKPKAIITSAYRYYATDAFDLDVIDYLLKPYPFDRFMKAVSKVALTDSKLPIATKNTSGRPFIFVKGNKQLHKVYIDDILFIESQRDYVKFHMQNPPDVISRQTIAYYEEFLHSGSFLRVHRSFIVAISKVTLVEASRLFLGDMPIPVGRSYRQQVLETLKFIQA